MQEKGYGFVPSGRADLYIGYVAALVGDLDDDKLQEIYGFDTGWRPNDNPRKYEKGTLIVDIMQNYPRRLIWRGAIQMNVGFDLSDKVRWQRTQLAAQLLLRRFNP